MYGYEEWLGFQRIAGEEFGRRVHGVTDWSAPTPDDEWDVRALVVHVTEEQQWVPPLLDGRSLRQAKLMLEPLGDDLVVAWDTHQERASRAWRSHDERQHVQLSYDTVTALHYLREQVADVAIHTWDLARAIGDDETLDEALVAAVWTVFEPQRETLEASGLYASPVAIDDSAPLQTRLLALTGRDPR
ncbi:TIGR03086 family metal-binding protein [Labedella phragmitis]|uniref:TIGR03086 family metal-binding protein n=1 Tax=Labedella phragmitis TaxID=2498849 RepID=UPI001FB70443|nr:TIGR03086 family metal-binding protein [Labedella phragmitis]